MSDVTPMDDVSGPIYSGYVSISLRRIDRYSLPSLHGPEAEYFFEESELHIYVNYVSHTKNSWHTAELNASPL